MYEMNNQNCNQTYVCVCVCGILDHKTVVADNQQEREYFVSGAYIEISQKEKERERDHEEARKMCKWICLLSYKKESLSLFLGYCCRRK